MNGFEFISNSSEYKYHEKNKPEGPHKVGWCLFIS